MRDGKSDSEIAAEHYGWQPGLESEVLRARVDRIAALAKAKDLRERGVRGDRQMDPIEEGEDG